MANYSKKCNAIAATNNLCLVFPEENDYDVDIDPQEEEILAELDTLIGEFQPEVGSMAARRAAEQDMRAEEAEELQPYMEAREAVKAANRAVRAAKRSCQAAVSAYLKANSLQERRLRKMDQIEQLKREIEELQTQEDFLRANGGSSTHVSNAQRVLDTAKKSLAHAKGVLHMFEADEY